MDVTITPVSDAEGYYIRFGVSPDKLYTHIQVMHDRLTDTPVRIGCLNRLATYYVMVDAYNDSGVIKGTDIKLCACPDAGR